MAYLSIVWITDAMLNIFLYIANEKCENMSSHSEKYPSSCIHHVPWLEKQSLKVCVLLFISSCILLLLPPSLWSCLPTTDTILRERGVHQLLKRLVVVKARKPRLKQSRLCSCHLVGDFKISLSLDTSPVYVLPSGNAPNTHINLGPAKVVGLISLPPYSAA